VFVFLSYSLFVSQKLLGWSRTARLFGLTWAVAFLCEYSSTRIGFPFGDYFYTGSTLGEELYILNIPFMDSLSFSFLLFASYCLALAFTLPQADPAQRGTRADWIFDPSCRLSWPVLALTVLFFTFSDIVIDPRPCSPTRGSLVSWPNIRVSAGRVLFRSPFGQFWGLGGGGKYIHAALSVAGTTMVSQ